MHEMPQQQFDYGIATDLPPPPHEQEGPSQGAEVIPSKTMAPVPSEGIWGTQPPLDPSLMDIAKIAVLTRKSIGTDNLTLLIPKVRFLLPLFGFSA
jgi:hypothetical protein